MMHEYIYKIVKDCDGVYCYIKQGEIIRCKDCKYWKRSSCCEGYCGEIDMEGFDEDHYCGFAERRTE